MNKEFTILVADDEPAYLEAIVDFLSDTEYHILNAVNGKMACEISRKNQPDLIILDWEMPIMSGLETIHELKKEETTKHIPIIMSSGVMTTSKNLKTALDAGAVDYIRKPVDKLELIARINSMLKLSQSYKQIIEQNKNLAQQREEMKEQSNFLMRQGDRVARQHEQIRQQKEEIQKKNEQITSSIGYAWRIQHALLPQNEMFNHLFPSSFVLYKPRDIVSGDFYWLKKFDDKIIVAVADCTGHGVPGAFMSIMGITYLNDLVINKGFDSPSEILESLRHQIKTSLHQTGKVNETNDGLDIALCVIDMDNGRLNYAGANIPLYLITSKDKGFKTSSKSYTYTKDDDNQLIEINADRMPIGIYINESKFHEHSIPVSVIKTVYLFTDGYADQFGGEKGKKLKTRYFRQTLLEIQDYTLPEQKSILNKNIEQWRGNNEQVDDILVLGFSLQNIYNEIT